MSVMGKTPYKGKERTNKTESVQGRKKTLRENFSTILIRIDLSFVQGVISVYDSLFSLVDLAAIAVSSLACFLTFAVLCASNCTR